MKTCGHSTTSCIQHSVKSVLPGVCLQIMENRDSVFQRFHPYRLECIYKTSLPPCSSSVTPQNQSYCGTSFITISVMTYPTAYSVPDIRTLKIQRFSIMACGLANRSQPKPSKNALKTFQICHFQTMSGTLKLKIHLLVNSSTMIAVMSVLWPRNKSCYSTLSNITHKNRLFHLSNHRLAVLFS